MMLEMLEMVRCAVGLLDLGLGVRSQKVSGTKKNKRTPAKPTTIATTLHK
jgi:hypothetical protein